MGSWRGPFAFAALCALHVQRPTVQRARASPGEVASALQNLKKWGGGMTDISDATTRTMDIITLKQPLPQLTHSQPFPHHGKRFQFAQSNS